MKFIEHKKKKYLKFEQLRFFFFLEKIEYNDARALCDHLNQKSRGPKFCHKCLRRDKKKSQI